MKLKGLILGMAMLLAGGLAHGAPASPCEDQCYQAKSTAYQHCRIISPADRAARRACFNKADADLKRCLKTCR